MEIKIFISYSAKDDNLMKSLSKIIKSSKHLIPIVVPRRVQKLGKDKKTLTPLYEKVINGLNEADFVCPILTEKSYQTQWINQEIGYAKAIDKPIVPIVQNTLLSEKELKGFITKDIGIDYVFTEHNTVKNRWSSYRKECQKMVNQILIDYDLLPNISELEELFPESWNSSFDKNVKIEDKKYYINNIHYFNIDKIKFDLRKEEISFRKVRIRDLKHPHYYRVKLKIKSINKHYSGTEEVSSDGKIYSKPYKMEFNHIEEIPKHHGGYGMGANM